MTRAYLFLLSAMLMLGCVSQCEPPACCEPVKIMPLGDSITMGTSRYLDPPGYFGYRRDLYCSLARSRAIDFVGSLSNGAGFDGDHEGHSGWTASALNEQLLSFLQQADPDIILYHIGTNNLWGNDTAAYAEDVNRSLGIIYSFNPDITVMLAKVVLTLQEPERNVRTHNYNLLLEEVASYWSSAGYSVEMVDMESALSQTMLDMEDNLHPTARGYALMAGVWYEALARVIPVCSCG